jgi:LysM repeat protein
MPPSTEGSVEPTEAPTRPISIDPTPTAQVALTPAHAPIHYLAQSGDTLPIVASRFGFQPDEILSPNPLPEQGFITPGQLLIMPPRLGELLPPAIEISTPHLLPDSEIVFGPSAVDFDVSAYLDEKGGFLSTYREYLGTTAWTSASDVITRIALENSINPRLLLALMEHECGCVLGDSSGKLKDGYVLGVEDFHYQWLYLQLGWAANQLSIGYYGWRDGSLREIHLPDGQIVRPAPGSNAGSVALINYFANLAAQKALQEIPAGQQSFVDLIHIDLDWTKVLDLDQGFPALHHQMYADPWERAREVEPLFPKGISQPELNLPFEPGYVWSYTSGPHKAWQTEGALAALDLAPSTKKTGCVPTKAYATAVADGPIVRIGNGYVIQDLDSPDAEGVQSASDGFEQTGWAILYMHIASQDRVTLGTYLHAGDRIGHPSCEGGPATGTHLHIARKYNGEWIAADGPLPFVLSGWVAHAGEKPFEGTLTKGEQIVIAHPYGSFETLIFIPEEDDKSE